MARRRVGDPLSFVKESEVLKAAKQYLDVLQQLGRLHYWRNNTGGATYGKQYVAYGVKGGSDYLGLIRPEGRFLAVEIKRPVGGHVRKEQKAFLDAVNAAGGLGFIATSVPEIQAKLKEAGYAWA